MASSRKRELSPVETENDPLARAALVEDDDPEIFQEPVMKRENHHKAQY